MMTKALALLGVAFSSFAFSSNVAQAASLRCYNPHMEITLHQDPDDPKLYETEWIQFNVNTPAGNGTLYVDANNHAICRIDTPTLPVEVDWTFASTNTNNGAVRIEFETVPASSRRIIVMPASQSPTILGIRFKIRVR